ncbi:amidohydrolase family protein [Microlunatus soli]|uniref:Aminocarboxymuconate-semialdehyde decarboxylase n=1 Tax=Microlunatus soli TaxID=630515 RepID=A0A1H1RFF1_9ACTN|nr:amidohydrolase family protein [Microlunatus soli]SDS34507.1 aminocarboxymuconate-semialdehyde decarboxylase [Microlunatus soli]
MDQPAAIDTHAHIYPTWYLDRLEQIGINPATTAIARGLDADSTDHDIAQRLLWMDRAGVATQVIAPTPQVPAGPDPASSQATARMINDEYIDIAGRYPGRFDVYGAPPLPHIDQSVSEICRLFARTPAVGVSITTTLPDATSIASPRLDPVCAALDDHAAVVNIHPTGFGAFSPMITEPRLEWVNGAPVEDATATLQLLKADIPGRYPRIRFHIAHLGGDLPFLAQRIEDNYADWNAFPASPVQTLRAMWFDAANFHTPSLVLTRNTFGSDRILAGSDHPYFQHDKYVRAFDYIRAAPLPDIDIHDILAGNARALYEGRRPTA